MKNEKLLKSLLWLTALTVIISVFIAIKKHYIETSEPDVSITPQTTNVHRNLACAPRIQRKINITGKPSRLYAINQQNDENKRMFTP